MAIVYVCWRYHRGSSFTMLRILDLAGALFAMCRRVGSVEFQTRTAWWWMFLRLSSDFASETNSCRVMARDCLSKLVFLRKMSDSGESGTFCDCHTSINLSSADILFRDCIPVSWQSSMIGVRSVRRRPDAILIASFSAICRVRCSNEVGSLFARRTVP